MILYIKNMFLIGRRKRGRSGFPGGLPAGLALAAHRGKHTRATQKSTRHARHTQNL